MITARPTAYHVELALPLGGSRRSVGRGLKKLKLSRKKTTTYREKDDECRRSFLEQLKQIPEETLVYVDESALDKAIQREYGYAVKGQRLPGEVRGKRFAPRHRIIAGLLAGNALAPWVFNGYCDTEVVFTWVNHVLVPELKPDMPVVMDRASFHETSAITEAIKAAGCHLLFHRLTRPLSIHSRSGPAVI